MLILTRNIDQTLVVGDDVTITILGVRGNQIRIGIDAPKEVSVHRKEIYDRIQKEKISNKLQDSGKGVTYKRKSRPLEIV